MKKVVVSAGLVLGLTIAVVYGYQKTESMGQNAAPKAADVNSATEQKTCPVMGGPINTKYFTEYKGKKVYFCCPGCKPEFEKNPEKYIDKLPQFSNKK